MIQEITKLYIHSSLERTLKETIRSVENNLYVYVKLGHGLLIPIF